MSNALPGGTKLVRHYDANSVLSVDQQCGSAAYHASLISQMENQLCFFFSVDGSGTHLFFKHVTFNVYASAGSDPSKNVPFPTSGDEAHCEDVGNSDSVISIRYFPETQVFNGKQVLYRFEAALSHETGHAFHNWARAFSFSAYSKTFQEVFEHLVSVDGSTSDMPGKPWHGTWSGTGINGRDENAVEQFANMFRCFLGADITRGQTGPSSRFDKGVPGFKDPGTNPNWKKMLILLPHLTAYWRAYGVAANVSCPARNTPAAHFWDGFNVRWLGSGDDGMWWFVNKAGHQVVLQNLYVWYELGPSGQWQRTYPTYRIE